MYLLLSPVMLDMIMKNVPCIIKELTSCTGVIGGEKYEFLKDELTQKLDALDSIESKGNKNRR